MIRVGILHDSTIRGESRAKQSKAEQRRAKKSKVKQSNFYLLTQAECVAAIQLTWAAALLPVPSELLLSTHSPTSEGWTAELAVGLWLVVPTTGIEPTRVDLA